MTSASTAGPPTRWSAVTPWIGCRPEPVPEPSLPARPGRSDRLDGFQQNHPALGFPVAVIYKAFDDRAPYLAALVTYYAFVSLFPLLLLFVSVMGFILEAHPHLRQSVVNSAVDNLPGIGSELRQNLQTFKGSGLGIVLGVIGLAYGGLGAMQASQYAFNHIYAVPRFEQPNPVRSRVRSLRLLLLLGTAIIISTGINILVANGQTFSAELGTPLTIAGYATDLVINVVLFSMAYRVLTAIDLRLRDVLAGGFIAAVGWQILQAFGSRYVVHEARHGGALYGVFGVVLATVAWLYLVALVVMLSAEVNVVRHRHLWPRSLKAPFTDRMEPTRADLAAYDAYAHSPRFKGWQTIEVAFDPPVLSDVDDGDGAEGDEPVTPPV
jgi:membrane protein